MKGWVITRKAADGTKRYDACWWVGSRKKSKTFAKKKAADNYLTAMVKRVQDGTYVEVVPAHGGGVRPVARSRARGPLEGRQPQA